MIWHLVVTIGFLAVWSLMIRHVRKNLRMLQIRLMAKEVAQDERDLRYQQRLKRFLEDEKQFLHGINAITGAHHVHTVRNQEGRVRAVFLDCNLHEQFQEYMEREGAAPEMPERVVH